MVKVYTDGTAIVRQGISQAGWGVHFPDFTSHDTFGPLPGERQNSMRAELWAIKTALEIISQKRSTGESHTFYLDSGYCLNVFTKWIPTWRENNYTRSSGGLIQDADLLQDIDQLLPEVGPIDFLPHAYSNYPGHTVAEEHATKGAQSLQSN